MRRIKRELSNARIVAFSLEMTPVTWWIGKKVYEPGKILEFIESMWKRLKYFEKNGVAVVIGDHEEAMIRTVETITLHARQIKNGFSEKQDTTEDATGLFVALNHMSRMFTNMYFRTLSKSVRG